MIELAVLVLLFLAVPLPADAAKMAPGEKNAYIDRYWPFGFGDQVGAANLLVGKDLSRLAPYLAGDVYSLAFDVRHDDPALFARQCVQKLDYLALDSPNDLTGWDEYFYPCYNSLGTSIDGLGHIGRGSSFYGGVDVSEMSETIEVPNRSFGGNNEFTSGGPETFQTQRLTKLGLENMPPIVTRGIVLNMVDVFPDSSKGSIDGNQYLLAGTAITDSHLQAALDRQGLVIQEGDVVLIHTGWSHLFRNNNTVWLNGEPGLTVSGAKFLINRGIVVMGSDNWGMEVLPSVDPGSYPVHQVVLTDAGVYNMEGVDSREVVAKKVHEFLFMLAAPRFNGAVQGIIHPIAIGMPRSSQ